jgi:hypothetical protein
MCLKLKFTRDWSSSKCRTRLPALVRFFKIELLGSRKCSIETDLTIVQAKGPELQEQGPGLQSIGLIKVAFQRSPCQGREGTLPIVREELLLEERS